MQQWKNIHIDLDLGKYYYNFQTYSRVQADICNSETGRHLVVLTHSHALKKVLRSLVFLGNAIILKDLNTYLGRNAEAYFQNQSVFQ